MALGWASVVADSRSFPLVEVTAGAVVLSVVETVAFVC